MKSSKQISLEKKILYRLEGNTKLAAEWIFKNKEIQHLQDYANVVSIKRLGYNDHGPVHMRKAASNAIKMFDLLHERGIKFNLENEGIGTVDDSKTAVLIASLFHDFGMTVSREQHEHLSVILSLPYIEKILKKLYKENIVKQMILRSMIVEGIFGHMASHKIHSLEAGLVLVGDGCDMEKGRARITSLLSSQPKVGDIHKYSASAINNVEIVAGKDKPIQINVEMTESVGFFQIEEVLFPKINFSPVKPYIELYAWVQGEEKQKYL